MPTAPLDSEGTELFFTDSGAVPDSSNYTTLVIYHGCGFNGNIFKKLIPLAADDNVRLVIVNRCDYAGSTKYSDAELEDMNAGRKCFLERLAVEVANFLVWFIHIHKIPEISADRKSGGLSLMGWSMGSVASLTLLGQSEAVSTDIYSKLEPYIRQFVVYDPPHVALGYDPPPEGYNPFIDPAFDSPPAIMDNFSHWISEHYIHPGLPARSVLDLDFSKRGVRPSIGNMAPDECAITLDGVAAARVELPMIFSMQPILKEQVHKALFNEKLAETYCVFGFIETERLYKQHVQEGKKVRPIGFIEIEDANHFVHWDAPEVFWATALQVISGINSSSSEETDHPKISSPAANASSRSTGSSQYL